MIEATVLHADSEMFEESVVVAVTYVAIAFAEQEIIEFAKRVEDRFLKLGENFGTADIEMVRDELLTEIKSKQ